MRKQRLVHNKANKESNILHNDIKSIILLLMFVTFIPYIVIICSKWRTSSYQQLGNLVGDGILELKFSSTRAAAEIEYSLINESIEDNVHYKLFAAFLITKYQIQYGNESAVMIAKDILSIKEWTEMISFGANNNKLIEDFTNQINQATSDPKFKAYFFETNGVTMNNASNKQFEFVLTQADELHKSCIENGPRPDIFQEHLSCGLSSSTTCCTFYNLDRTAKLISPKELGEYSHIGAFLRNASRNEVHQMWKTVTKEYILSLKTNPSKRFWLSTSGLKVSWLHFRIDEKPKSYAYKPFRMES